MPSNPAKALVAEFIGTFTLIFIGVLSIVAVKIVGSTDPVANLASIGLAHGLAIGVMVAALGAVSGGHFNPAITFGFVVTGRLPVVKGITYWIAQLVGASAAGFLIAGLFGADMVAAGTPGLGNNVSQGAGIAIEAVGTFFLVLVVFGTAVDERAPKSVYPFAIGLTIAIDIMAIGLLSGGAVNPARSFGPALASHHWDNEMVYWVGPLIGGGLAGLLYHFFLIEKSPSAATAARGGPAPAEERGNA